MDEVHSTCHPLAILRGQLDPKLLAQASGRRGSTCLFCSALHLAALHELGIEIPITQEETEAQRNVLVCKNLQNPLGQDSA